MNKIGRKIYHLSGGIVLVGLYAAMDRADGLAMLLGVFAFATALDLARLRIPAFNEFFYRYFPKFIRESERDRLTGTPWYMLGILCAASFYGLPVAVYAVAFLACGDVAATTVGERWGKTKLFGEKSLQGTAAFFVVSLAAGLTARAAGFELSLPVMAAGATAATVVEALPLRVNDNLTIPLISGGLMRLMVCAGL